MAELVEPATAKNFDGIGASSKFGDNMLTLSAGLSFTLGKVGYRRIVDANPYIAQNEWLLLYADRLAARNNRLSTCQHKEDERIKDEYRKILEIEGLLTSINIGLEITAMRKNIPSIPVMTILV